MKAVLMMAYSSLASIDDVPAFYQHIFHGQVPDSKIIEDGIQKYREIGTADPLTSITHRQAQSLSRRLSRRFGEYIPVYLAMKHTSPFVEEVLPQLVQDGVTDLYVLPMTPLYSKSGTESYYRSVVKARDQLKADFPVNLIAHWHLQPDFVEVIASRLRTAEAWLSTEGRRNPVVLFTTHSKPGLPSANREYIEAYTELAGAAASAAQISSWQLCYRSGGPAPQRWLGPDLRDAMQESAAAGATAIIVCDLLTTAENIEVIHDCRIDGMQQAKDLQIEFVCAEFPNDTDDFMDALETIAADRILGTEQLFK